MEGIVGLEPKRRGRKRKNMEVQNVTTDTDGKKRAVGTRSKVYVGRYVRKEFEGSGLFLGKIVTYDSGLYRVDYEDGDCEDLESGEAREFLIEENELDGEWLERKKNLDELVSNKYEKEKGAQYHVVDSNTKLDDVVVDKADAATFSVGMSNGGDNISSQVEGGQYHVVDSNAILDDVVVDKVQATLLSVGMSNGGGNNSDQVEGAQSDADDDLSSESCEDDLEPDSRSEVVEVPLVPPPELPPSSGNIGISEEYVSHLLSAYSLLRSFSVQLFLSPFGLDDFVGSLNCTVPNTLFDSIHVALMRTLRGHLEKLSSDGSEPAAKCLRFLDWSLLDMLTWPVYLVHYLMLMGYMDGPEWKGFYAHAMEKNYYTLSAGRKLLVLQILCDVVLDCEELRTEIDIREESEVGLDSDAGMAMTRLSGPRRVHPRYSKTSACKDQEAIEIMAINHETSKVGGHDAGSDVDQDLNSDECRLCGMDGILLCCDGCPSSYHSRCIGVSKLSIAEGEWFCPECTISKIGPMIMRGTALKGAEIFGIDPYKQVFVGTCEHLLVLDGSINSNTCLRYYNHNDIPTLLETLNSNAQHIALYEEICNGIIRYWEMPLGLLYFIRNTSETSMIDQTSSSTITQSEHLQQSRDCDSLTQPSGISVDSVVEQNPVQAAALTGLFSQTVAQLDSTRHLYHQEASDRYSGTGFKKLGDVTLYLGSSFKIQGYTNNYLHGDFAASAAASLAALSSEENQVPASNIVDRRKVVSANYSLQAKAFSAAAVRFFWPHTERKLVEGPRERCSWCLSCKAPVSSKRGCLLNAAVSTAIKGAMKVLATLRPAKNVEGTIPGIATYVILMEESLKGLTVGPFLNSGFRKQWRKQLEQASTCHIIKILLLELEENIRPIALAWDWVKLVDGLSAELSVTKSGAASAAGSTQKRRPGRRGRKPSAVAEVAADDPKEILADFTWWRGGRFLKFLSQKGTLPCAMVKKAARQGGSRRMAGIYYAEGVDTAKTNRQLIWRAAVEKSKNAAQLALQVRYLDLNVKWADIIRPEQSLQEAKGPETESSVFRNAFISDKKIVDNEIRYCVTFGGQKHLPSKVMKNIIEKEQSQDGKERYWFSELRIPLYLIKEYEENIAELPLPSGQKSQNIWSKLQKKQLKASRKDIFLYLTRKRDNKEKIYCASCQRGLLLGNAVKCNTCQGLCHELCTVSSTVRMTEEVEYLIACKDCYHARALSQRENSNESPTSPLLLQGQEFSNAVIAEKDERLVVRNGSSVSSNVKPTKASRSASKSKSKCSWGLIWKKKNSDTGLDFRLKNILLKGNPDNDWSNPSCHLCHQPYSSDLTYIRCEACTNWYHAAAVELQEEKIDDLVGFKCCKCRRIRSPVCPFTNLEHTKKLEVKKLCVRGPKLENLGMGPNPGATSEQREEEAAPHLPPETMEMRYSSGDDPLLVSSSSVQQLSENPQVQYEWNTASVSGPQKLPVRRNVKREKDEDSNPGNGSVFAGSSTSFEGNILNSAGESSAPRVEWDVSTTACDDNLTFNYDSLDYEDMEFAPQTYFSFNELLAADDGGSLDGLEPLPDITGNWETSYAVQKNEGPDSSHHEQEATVPMDFASDTAPCKMCFHADPPPDLFCHICGLWMHSHCSPWVEPPRLDEGGWKCAYCRDWQ